MIDITNTRVEGFMAAIRGMRNPMNSWDKMDSYDYIQGQKPYTFVGENDRKLMEKLAMAGSDHGKFLRMITVTCDILAPLYWWKEFDTYKVGTVANSCSTMHKIAAKEFTREDFSYEHLTASNKELLDDIIDELNSARASFNNSKTKDNWWQMIQLLPTSYNQFRTVQLNYAVLKNIYHARKGHKLDEWRDLCSWIVGLPESQIIVRKSEDKILEEKIAKNEAGAKAKELFNEAMKKFQEYSETLEEAEDE